MGKFDALKERRMEIPTEEGEMEEGTGFAEVQSLSVATTTPKRKATSTKSRTTKTKPQKPVPQIPVLEEVLPKVGRPKGRRSDPDYTQISAYIPLDLLLSVQDVLAGEQREFRRRTARPVSELIEELLAEWLHTQNVKNSKV